MRSFSAADPELVGMLKKNQSIFGSPAVAHVDMCEISAEQIADELNQFLKTVQPDLP